MMRREFGDGQGERFHPTLRGCVAKDVRMARALEGCYLRALYEVSAQSYRSILCEQSDRRLAELFEELAQAALVRFRMLGEMIAALGGNPAIRVGLRIEPYAIFEDPCEEGEREADRMLRDSIREKKREIDRMQSLLGKAQDRVLRAALASMISQEQEYAERLGEALI